MNISATYQSASLSIASQTFQSAVAIPAKPPQPSEPEDTVLVSDEARKSSRTSGTPADPRLDATLQLVRDLLSQLTGVGSDEVEAAPEQTESLPETFIAGSYQETAVSARQVSLSFDGTVSTKDGKELGFSLALEFDQVSAAVQTASFQAAPDGLSVNYAGTAAELSSTSFSFSLSMAETGPTTGKGSFKMNDEISSIARQVKPLAKDFMEASGIHGGWGHMNRFLRSVA